MQPPVKLFKGGEEKQKYKEKIMKKFFGLALAGIMAASTVAFAVPAYGVSADEAAATVIKPFALYEFQDASKPGKDTSGNGYDLVAKTRFGGKIYRQRRHTLRARRSR